MNLFHRHKWKVIRETYSPKIDRAMTVKGMGPEDLNRILRSVTTVLLQCEKCSEVRKEEMFGELK